MEDAAAIRYWCHMCSRSVDPVIEAEMIKCNFCQSGFVEEMDNAPDSATDDHHRAAESLWAPILIGMINDHDHHTRNQRASESNVEDEDEDEDDDDDDDDDDENNDGEVNLDQQFEQIMRIRRSHSAAIHDLLQGIRAGLSVETETSADNPGSELVVLINSFSQRLRIQDPGDTTSVPSGTLGDYFIGPGFEMLLQRLAENDPNNRYGTPPATKEAVEALAMVKIEESLQCTVCLDDFEIGTEAKEMPCKHKFHGDCLLPWLELHSSCPVCRYLLPKGDDEDEAKTDAEVSRNDDNSDGIIIASMESNGSSEESSSNISSAN